MLALWWERRQEDIQLARDTEALEGRNSTEVRRRFAPVRVEIKKNAESVDFLSDKLDVNREQTTFTVLHPQLLEGAWIANAPRLSQLVADYDLIGDLAMAYGRIEELRWRLRYRSELRTYIVDGMTAPLVAELREELADLLQRVSAQIDQPDVQPVGLLSKLDQSSSVRPVGSLSIDVIRGVESVQSASAQSPVDNEPRET